VRTGTTIDVPETRIRLSQSLRGKRVQFVVKRAFDLLGASCLLLLFAPLLMATALVIMVSSPGPALFCQTREGYRGRLFTLWKFRSMRLQHDTITTEAQRVAAEEGRLIKQRNDPRVTAVGRFIRAASIDELPQLFNVLKGEMSLVGPRPLVPFMLAPHPEFREVRGLVRPGLTGLWQIRERENNTSAACMMPHDLEYLARFSPGCADPGSNHQGRGLGEGGVLKTIP
jgi:exopolysaccharide production protein ExoY